MIRAIFLDFYGVWTPDRFSEYLAVADQHGPAVKQKLQQAVDQYFRGQIGPEEIAGAFRYNLSRPDIDSAQFVLSEANVYPAIVNFMRGLHGHFVKLGILANLGPQEYKLLSDFSSHNQVFEVIASPQSLQLEVPLLSQEVFASALQAIGEPPQSCLVVSGNPDYLNFARSLGIATLPYQGYAKLQQDLDQLLSSETA